MVVFGAGGAARAVAVETALAGARRLTIVNRDSERGQELAVLLNERTSATASFLPWRAAFAIPDSADIVVNATSIGLFPDVGATLDIDLDTVRSELLVADVIPNPPRTALLRAAAERGCDSLDGLGMLVNQGIISIRPGPASTPTRW